jgi:hypothetical protein
MIDTKKNAPRGNEGQTDNLTGKPNVARSAQRAKLFSFEAQKIGTQAGLIVGESDEEEVNRILFMVKEVFPNAKLIRTEDNSRRSSNRPEDRPKNSANLPSNGQVVRAVTTRCNYPGPEQQFFQFADERNGDR